MNTSVRLRADPEIIRIGVRHNSKLGNSYTATISYTQEYLTKQTQKGYTYKSGLYVSHTADNAADAVMMALKKAKKSAPPFDGIDLEMEWVYDHPQKSKPE